MLASSNGGVEAEIKGTYDVLIFLCVVSYLRQCNCPTNVLGIFRFAWSPSANAHVRTQAPRHLRIPSEA